MVVSLLYVRFYFWSCRALAEENGNILIHFLISPKTKYSLYLSAFIICLCFASEAEDDGDSLIAAWLSLTSLPMCCSRSNILL